MFKREHAKVKKLRLEPLMHPNPLPSQRPALRSAAMASIMPPRDDEMEQALALSLAMSNLERPTRPERASVDSDTDQALREAMEASRREAEETSAEDVAAQRALELAIKESLRPPEASLDDFGGPSMQGSSLELAIDLGSGGGAAAPHTLQGGASGMYRSLAADDAQPYMGGAAQPPYMEGEVWTGSPHTPSPAVSLPPEEVSWDAASTLQGDRVRIKANCRDVQLIGRWGHVLRYGAQVEVRLEGSDDVVSVNHNELELLEDAPPWRAPEGSPLHKAPQTRAYDAGSGAGGHDGFGQLPDQTLPRSSKMLGFLQEEEPSRGEPGGASPPPQRMMGWDVGGSSSGHAAGASAGHAH